MITFINIHQLMGRPERWDFWTLWIAQRRWKPLCLGCCWNGGVGQCCLQGFCYPFCGQHHFFLFKDWWMFFFELLNRFVFVDVSSDKQMGVVLHMFCDRNRLSLRVVQNEGDMEWNWRHYSGIIRMKQVSRFSMFRLREQGDENKCPDWTSNHLLAFSSTLLDLK